MKNSGRPKKNSHDTDSRTEFINAAIKIIKDIGVEKLTVRSVCNEAGLSIGTFYHFFQDKNDLLMDFIKEPFFSSFENISLKTPLNDISGLITELYMLLIKRYMKLGRDFVKSFYSSDNRILSAYMSEKDGKFMPGTIMERCEKELLLAYQEGFIKISDDDDIHTISADICSIVKGCVFEWCLNSEDIDLEILTGRIIKNYMFRMDCSHIVNKMPYNSII